MSRIATFVLTLGLVVPCAHAVDVPLSFEANAGQAAKKFAFVAHAGRYNVGFASSSIAMSSGGEVALWLRFKGGARHPRLAGVGSPRGTANYFIGNDPTKWRTGVPTFEQVRYENVYPGVDVVCYGSRGRIEYDFVVAPGADPGAVVLHFDGARLRLDGQGDLMLTSATSVVRLTRPSIYQQLGRRRQRVDGQYRLFGGSDAGIRVARYDRTRPLIIDPVLVYSTYLGGSSDDYAFGIATDASGSAYVTGQTNSFDFPTVNPAQPRNGNGSIFVSKLNPAGSALVYSAYIGGRALDVPASIAVDPAGNAYVTGLTQSPDFPVMNALQPATSNGIQDSFVLKLDASGSALVFSTYLSGGGGSRASGIALDRGGNIYVTGIGSAPFTTSAFSGNLFLVKLNPAGSVLLFGINFGGASNLAWPGGVAADAAGNVYVTAGTGASDFTTRNALQPSRRGIRDAIVMKLSMEEVAGALFDDGFDSENNGLEAQSYTAFRNWTVDSGGGADLRAAGSGLAVALTGTLTSRNAFSLAPAVSSLPAINPGMYRLEFSAGGAHGGAASTLTVRVGGVCTETFSIPDGAALANVIRDFPVTASTDARLSFESSGGTVLLDNVKLSRLQQNPTLLYSTYLGGSGDDFGVGIAADDAGNAYVTGQTTSLDFPTRNAAQPAPGGGVDTFVAKIDPAGSALVYATYVGGSYDETSGGIAVDRAGNAHVAGSTASGNFPLAHPIQSHNNGPTDAFLIKLDSLGAFVYSTYLGGTFSDLGNAVAVDDAGIAYVAGHTTSADFPVANALQPRAATTFAAEAFIAKIVDSRAAQLVGVTPSRGGNAGTITIGIVGASFPHGPVSVKLVTAGGAEIAASDAVVMSATLVSAIFNLSGAPAGPCDVVVTFHDVAPATLPAAFTIEAGGDAQVWADLVGRADLRFGVPSTLYLVVGNRGDIDAIGVPVTIHGFPRSGMDIAVDLGDDDDDVSPVAQLDDETILPLLFTKVSPGLPLVLSIVVTPRTNVAFDLTVSAGAPVFRHGAPVFAKGALAASATSPFLFAPDAMLCINDVAGLMADAAGLVPGGSCVEGIVEGVTSGIFAGVADVAKAAMHQPIVPISKIILNSLADAAVGCAEELPLADLLKGWRAGLHALDAIEDCAKLRNPFGPYPYRSVGAVDPNEKRGPRGTDTERWIAGAESLRYAIYFENLTTATAAARDVMIVDRLDAAHVNLDALTLGPIDAGLVHVTPPPGLADYTTEVDLRPATNLLVAVDAHVDRTRGALQWHLSALDPATHQPPADPLAGFLPPDVNPPEGAGSVFFTVEPKTALPTGTAIANDASITFDENAPIATAAWQNTIDNDRPESRVGALPAAQCAAFPVSWSGTDSGSGIAGYSVFVSDNGAPPARWLANTTAASALFSGEAGHDYAFYSVARDRAGNVEDAPSLADARVTPRDTQPPTIVLNGPAQTMIDALEIFVDPGATAMDNCAGPVAVSVAGAVDATVPNDYVLTYTATDPSANSRSITRGVKVLAPIAVKSGVLAHLVALGDSHVAEAIRHLTKSTDPALWSDASHPRPNGGESVFNEEKETVRQLAEPGGGDTVRLVRADRFIAFNAIREVAAGDAKKLADAAGELRQGDSDAAQAKPESAIEHYKNAWLKALDAQKK